jgi:prophage tail gpP-like protein
MAQAHEVTLTLRSSGTRLTVWDQYDIVLDLFEPGSPWTFTLWHSDAEDSAWRRLNAEVQEGAEILVAIDGAPQLTGRIEERRTKVDDTGATLTISGRDLAGPALTWNADPRIVLRGRTVESALGELFNRVGIEVLVGANANAAREVQTRARPGAHGAHATSRRSTRRNRVDLSRARPDETVWQVAESICRKLGYMMWVAPSDLAASQLALVVDVPDYETPVLFAFERRVREGAVTQESKILASELVLSIRDVPTVVYAFGRAPRGDVRPARHASAAQNDRLLSVQLSPLSAGGLARLPDAGAAPAPLTASTTSPAPATRLPYQNDGLARWPQVVSPLPPQPKFLHTRRALNPATGRQAAERFMSEAMRKFRLYTVTVQGHGQTIDGRMRLYAINTMARVYDRLSELDEEMLIHRVQFTGGRDGGEVTRLTLGTKGAYVLQPEAP